MTALFVSGLMFDTWVASSRPRIMTGIHVHDIRRQWIIWAHLASALRDSSYGLFEALEV